LREFPVLFLDIGVDAFVVEAGQRWLDTVSLSHVEVLSEVLVSAPPVGPDHVQSLVSSDLMEVRVSDIVLLSVHGESSVSVGSAVCLVGLSEPVPPVLDHSFLLFSNKL
jgi:hypothetical protein